MDTERNVADGPTVVRAIVLAERPETDRAHVRGTDAYISLCVHSRVTNHRAKCRRRSYRRTRAAQTERSETERTHVRGTDAYIALCDYSRVTNHRAKCRRRSYRRTRFGQTERSETDRAYVRGTDAYISLCDYSRVTNYRAVVRARPKQSALKQNAPTSGGLTPTLRSTNNQHDANPKKPGVYFTPAKAAKTRAQRSCSRLSRVVLGVRHSLATSSSSGASNRLRSKV